MHTIEVNERILHPEDGFILGNGDLSVSVYQTDDRIIWRFGKSDVWDRRLDLSKDPAPAHIDEIARGIMEEGWVCGPYGGQVYAKHGADNPQRMQEICQGVPPSYNTQPYPCPKPVGELAMQLPPDQTGLKIWQCLRIEDAKVHIRCSYASGVSIEVEAYIHPFLNVLVVEWRTDHWGEETRTGHTLPPVWFSLYRWADPYIQQFNARFFREYRVKPVPGPIDSDVSPLAAPTVEWEGNWAYIAQSFPPDPLFPDGFRYVIAPMAADTLIEPVEAEDGEEARIHILPRNMAGRVLVLVASSSDEGGDEAGLARLVQEAQSPDTVTRWEEELARKAKEFWFRSSVSIADRLLENLWYETLHIRRCTYAGGKIPPGLFLPSTVQDFSIWHGDYHTNYNFQQPFWGDLTANHPELCDAYFDGMQFFLPVGRKIARDYYNCRGVFIQLSGYPIALEDDPLGVAPMGRMAYMTGWATTLYWWKYLYTMDKDWLASVGYPVIRDCALFYADFMRRGPDGFYHAFPSNVGEDGFTGNSEDYTDRAQVMEHVRYCLRAAIMASEELKVDAELRALLNERLEHCAGNDGDHPLLLTGDAKLRYESNPPEFTLDFRKQGEEGEPGRSGSEKKSGGRGSGRDGKIEGDSKMPLSEFGSYLLLLDNDHFPPDLHAWYFGKYPFLLMQQLRSDSYSTDRDFAAFRKLVERWRRPNGALRAMSLADYGRGGTWTEALGIIAPLQEMMLQSRGGELRLFPYWPDRLDASYADLRAEGAFLISASHIGGEIRNAAVFSERGMPCCLFDPWKSGARVVDAGGLEVETEKSKGGRIRFETAAGMRYRLLPPGDGQERQQS